MTRRGRKLRPEEEALWGEVAKTTQRLTPARPNVFEDAARETKPAKTPVAEPKSGFDLPKRMNGRGHGGSAVNLSPSIADQVSAAPLQMDRKTFSNMKRGRLAPEGRIDLHGMTQDRAHGALTAFLLRAHAQGKRLVLVITGKGKEDRGADLMPVRTGVLRHQVPHWLELPPLKQVVQQVAQAHRKHGGGGAYYVYLRRMR